jgi:catabolite regulation protein CreA
MWKTLPRSLASLIVLGTMSVSPVLAGSRTVAEIPTSGFFFKDSLNIQSISDPALPGVTLYLGDFQKPLTEKLGGDFSDPTSSAITCAQTGTITAKELASIPSGKEGQEIFSESKNLLFKSVKIRRVRDQNDGALIYSSFSSRGDKGNDKNKSRFTASICAVMPHDLL